MAKLTEAINFGDGRLPERFWSKIQPCPMSGCWLWYAATTGHGYGSFTVAGVSHRAHRYAYEMLVSSVPPGLELDHICRVRCCVNPAHVEPVTSSENTRRSPVVMSGGAILKRRQTTHCPNGHALVGDNLYNISTRKNRKCRACQIGRRRAKTGLTPKQVRALRAIASCGERGRSGTGLGMGILPGLVRRELLRLDYQALTDTNHYYMTDAGRAALAEHDADGLTACECDSTHKNNNTVCRWCWAHGRRHWNDPEVGDCALAEHDKENP